ncbi:MAG: glycoside hydrolase family 30 beta sandwich domain-containing protein [Pirellulales bacterium]|nr:glycoside hydrolase family 30 beta sandwich domain-containing protein [Pirellulales bacterium]
MFQGFIRGVSGPKKNACYFASAVCAWALIVITANAQTQVTINQNQTYQRMAGFGASLTDSAGAALATLNPTARENLMRALFDPAAGAGLSFLRQPMGVSDFRRADYTYNDTLGDYAMTQFNINGDLALYPNSNVSLVSLLQSAQSHNPALRIMGSPWTAPGWMKAGTAGNIVPQPGVNQTLYAGTLNNNSQTIPAYANYFAKYVQAYAAQGLQIDYVTPQNEPYFNGGFAYPAMTLTPTQQGNLIRAIGQNFATATVNPALPHDPVTNPYLSQTTRIVMHDHNWSDAVTGNAPSTNITAILNNPAIAQYVHGVAFHGYGGDVSAQTIVHNAYPDKATFFTEQTGTVGSNFGNDLMYDMRTLVVGGTRNWASSIVKFNLALDQTSGPKIRTITFDNGGGNTVTADSGFNRARGVVTINSITGAITFNEEYYALGHIAKFVQPDAVRIDTNANKTVAFLNPDQTLALIAYNDAGQSQIFRFNWKGRFFTYQLPPQSAVTFRWQENLLSSPVEVYQTTGNRADLLARKANVRFIPEPGIWAWGLAILVMLAGYICHKQQFVLKFDGLGFIT